MESGLRDPIPLSSWQPTVSGNATLDLSVVPAGSASALRFDFDFKGGKGFVVARRAWARSMPGEYALRLRLRGHGPDNRVEIKLLDGSGRNVWRYVSRDPQPPSRWKRVTIESRDIEFAWGPESGSTLDELGFVEIAIVAGEGGRGSLWISHLEIEDTTPPQALTATASSEQPGFAADAALGGAGWKPKAGDRRPWIAVDSGRIHSIGGLIVDWLGGAPPEGFRVRASRNGSRWTVVHTAARAGGARSYVYLPGLRTRFLRLDLSSRSDGVKLSLQPFEFSRSIEAFWYAVANGAERGWHPRWLHREQSEWTPSGRSNGTQCALMNTDGMVEVAEGSFSLEPMLRIGRRLITWADVESRARLDEGWMPVPSVLWETADFNLTVTAQTAEDGEVRVSYRLENRTGSSLQAKLFVVVRPFQVTPPWQGFRDVGGVSRIHDLAWDGGLLRVNGALDVKAAAGARFGAMSFDDGFISSRLEQGSPPNVTTLHDEFGFATGAFEFDLAPAPHASCEHTLRAGPRAKVQSAAAPAFDWAGQMRADQWSGSGWAREAIEAALTATTHILITRSGPALQPGPRRYTRSWIRDGAMMSAALLRMGHAREVLEFIRWYAPHQRDDGFVPCCVDREGPDWLVEHDSHGQLLALIADYHRFTGDAEFLREVWHHVIKAVQCIEGLLESDGLLPISVSHEGYLAQPVHSYWDDFWALRGLGDAADLARIMSADGDAQRLGGGGEGGGGEGGGGELVRRWRALAARVGAGLFASIGATRAARNLDFIPGSAEWADFDPTATANAIYLLDVPEALDRHAVERTFDRYLADWRSKRAAGATSQSYTPYEIRIIGALVRLGRRDEALELLRFFLSDRRPEAWNQWPEIAWRDRKAPAHVGDLPHTWISAEYVLALRSLFAYEREADRVLVLAAGLAPEWIEGDGVTVRAMPTLYGALSYSIRRIDAHAVRIYIDSGTDCPILLKPPLAGSLRGATINGGPVDVGADSVTVSSLPAEVVCTAFG
jgi:hypothetical protein